jgi:two-component system sensor histidine kinase YesM
MFSAASSHKRPVRNQIQYIFCLAGILPIIILGVFSIFSMHKQMSDHYISLIKADGTNANSVLLDITTTIFTSTEPLTSNTTCQKGLALDRALSSSENAAMTNIDTAIDTFRKNTAAISKIMIYTDNPNISDMNYITSVSNYDGMDWRDKIGTKWQIWTCMDNTDLHGNAFRDLCLIKRIGVASKKYSAYLVIRLDNNYLRNRIQKTENEISVSVDGLPIIYSTDRKMTDKDMVTPDSYKDGFFKYTGPLTISGNKYLSDFISLRPYRTDDIFLIRTIDRTAYKNINSILLLYVVIISISVVLPFFLILRFSNYFSSRVTTLKSAMHKAKNGDYNIIDTFKGDDELTETFEDLKSTVNKIRDQEAQYYQARITEQELINRQQQMEYEMLAAQINPHFLYNTLETIRMQALASGNRDVAKSVKLLGKSMHYVLENTGTSSTTLTGELEYIKTYLEIQKLRFGERVNANIDISDEIDPDRCMILPLLLQPIVENAITHGLENSSTYGIVTISVSAYGEKDMLISIKDNGAGIEPDKLSELNSKMETGAPSDKRSIGLYNIGKRIRLFYGPSYYMKISSTIDVGTEVTLLLPQTFAESASESSHLNHAEPADQDNDISESTSKNRHMDKPL